MAFLRLTVCSLALLPGCPIIFDPELPGSEATSDPEGPPLQPGDDDDDDVGTEVTGTIPNIFELDAIEPHYGPGGGGTEVALRGIFPPNARVRFDGETAEVLSQSLDEIVVLSPLHPENGWIDVSIAVEGGELVASRGFQYWTDATGWTSMVGTLVYEEIVTGVLIEENNLERRAYGSLGFTLPADWSFLDKYTGSFGTCALNHESPVQLSYYETGASAVSFAAGVSVAEIPGLADGSFDGDVTPDVDVRPNEAYDLLTVEGSEHFPPLEIPDLLQIPALVEVTRPAIRGPDAAPTPPNVVVEWTPGSGDAVLLRLTWPGIIWDDVVTCIVADDGRFVVDADNWDPRYSLDPGTILHLQVARIAHQSHTLPHDNGESQVVGMAASYGLMIVQ